MRIKKGRKRMFYAIGGVIIVIVAIIGYMLLPYSPVKREFWGIVEPLIEQNKMPKSTITEKDLEPLPEVLQKYFIKNGYIGIETADHMTIDFKEADLALSQNQPMIKIDYLVHLFSKEPTRVVLIDAKMYGIPFQGIDFNRNAKGFMKGVLAKHFVLFNETHENNPGFNMIEASYLAECILHPSFMLQDHITYRELDDYSVEAVITYNGQERRGIFYFNEDYEMTQLLVEERHSSDTDTYEKWSAIVGEYKEVNGINLPSHFQAVWHYEGGEYIYFDSNDFEIYFE